MNLDECLNDAFRILRSRLRHKRAKDHDIDDVCQNTVAKYLEHMRKTGMRPQNPVGYVVRIGLREYSSLGRQRHLQPLPRDLVAAPMKGNPAQVLEDSEGRREVSRAIDCLPPLERDIAKLRLVEGWSQAQIRDATGLSVSALKSRLHRAVSRLRDRLKRHRRN